MHNPHQHGDLAWLLSVGMPKCGTTTLAALLDENEQVSVHNLKEPNDFLKDLHGELPSLSGYRILPETRFLVDFSTQYGHSDHRRTVFDNLRKAGQIDTARFILCLREPGELAESYYRHLLERRGYEGDSHEQEIRRILNDGTDFKSVLCDVLDAADASRIFITKLEDLYSLQRQRDTILAISDWLGVSANVPLAMHESNTKGSFREYYGPVGWIAGFLRQSNLGRAIPPRWRQRMNQVITRPVTRQDISFDQSEWLEPAILKDAQQIYAAISTGCLAGQKSVLSMIGSELAERENK